MIGVITFGSKCARYLQGVMRGLDVESVSFPIVSKAAAAFSRVSRTACALVKPEISSMSTAIVMYSPRVARKAKLRDTVAICGIVFAIAGWGLYTQVLQVPIRVPSGQRFLHGTCRWTVPPSLGAVLRVQSHLFVVPLTGEEEQHELATKLVERYATGEAISALRSDDEQGLLSEGEEGHILTLEAVNDVVLKKGFFGGSTYVDHGHELRIVHCKNVSPPKEGASFVRFAKISSEYE